LGVDQLRCDIAQCLIADKGNAPLRATLCTKNPGVTLIAPSRALSIYANIPKIGAQVFHEDIRFEF
jgi:hypothetical protein